MPTIFTTVEPALGPSLVRNFLWNFGGQAWGLALALCTTPYLIHKLGTDAYGLLMTVGIVTNYFWFADLGLGQATVKYAAEHASRGEWEDVCRIFWTSGAAYLILGAAAALLLVILTPLCVYQWFRVPLDLQPAAVNVFHLSALGFILGMVNNAPASLLRALQRFDITNKVSVGVGTTQTLLTLALLALGFSVQEVVLGNLTVAALSLALNTVIVCRLLPRLALPSWHLPTFRRLLRFGAFVSISGFVAPLLVNLEKLILANRLSLSAVTYYTVPYNLTNKLWIVAGALSSTLFPAFSSLNARQHIAVSAALSLRVSRYLLLLTMPFVALLFVFAEEVLELWVGPEFARQSSTPLRILAITMVVNALAWIPYVLIQSLGRPDITATFHFGELLLHLPLTLACVHYWGITGAALAWFIRVAIDSTLLWIATVRLTGLSWQKLASALSNQAFWALLGCGAVLWTLKPTLKEHLSSAALLTGLGGSFLALAALAGWTWGIGQEERQVIWRYLGLQVTRAHD